MAIEEVNQELWDLAEENVTKQQEKACACPIRHACPMLAITVECDYS